MTRKEIIEAFENLRYFESTDEIEWGKVQANADNAIEALKKKHSDNYGECTCPDLNCERCRNLIIESEPH